jgi:hypothetical protein
MNRLKLLFALSVAVNVACITLLLLYAASNSGVDGGPGFPRLGAYAGGDGTLTLPPDLQNNTQARAYHRLLSALRTSGLEEEQAHRILRGTALADWHEDRTRLHKTLLDSSQFWNSDVISFESDVGIQRQLVELRREKDAILSVLIGKTDSLARWYGHHGQIELPSLSAETRSALIMLEEDYDLLRLKIQSRSSLGGVLPEDLVDLRLLEAERWKDLTSLLSPEELEDYELRHSETAHRLRRDLIHFKATEAEFRDIFWLQRQFEAEFPAGIWAQVHNQAKRIEAEQALQRQLRQSLGDRRYLQLQRARNPDYRHLAGLAQRLALPIDRADIAYDFKTLVERQELAIQADPELTAEDRREAMQLLAQEAHRTVRESLGEELFQIYTAQRGWWLHRLEPLLPMPLETD